MNSKRQPIIMCLDVSGSMQFHNRMNRLNDAIEEFWSAIMNKTTVKHSTDLSIITFNHKIVSKSEFECMDVLSAPRIEAIEKSGTNMATALKQALETLDDYINKFKKSNSPYHVPILLLVTDGDPDEHNVDLKEIITEITKRNKAKELAPMIIGVGDDAEKFSTKLDCLTGGFANGKALIVGDSASEEDFLTLFRHLSNSVITSVSSTQAENTPSTHDYLERNIVSHRRRATLVFNKD